MTGKKGKLKYALIGCGRISPNHVAAALNNKGLIEIAALCDSDILKCKKLAGSFSLEDSVNFYSRYEEMLEKEKPDIVAVAVPSGLHAQISVECLNAGASVIVEKPIAMSLADADRMINTAKENGVLLCVCHQNRFNKSIQKIRSALEAGRFGRLYHGAAHIRWNRGRSYYNNAAWRGKWESDGGALMNQCIHDIDLLRWMMGDVRQVFSYTDRLAHPYIEAEDLGIAVISFKNGAYGIIEGTTNVYPKNLEETLYIFGEKGTVKAGGKSVNRIEEWDFADGLDKDGNVAEMFSEDPPNIYGFGHTPLYRDMAEAVLNGGRPYVDGTEGRKALELVLAVYKSAAEGRPVDFPLKECASADFKGRF